MAFRPKVKDILAVLAFAAFLLIRSYELNEPVDPYLGYIYYGEVTLLFFKFTVIAIALFQAYKVYRTNRPAVPLDLGADILKGNGRMDKSFDGI